MNSVADSDSADCGLIPHALAKYILGSPKSMASVLQSEIEEERYLYPVPKL